MQKFEIPHPKLSIVLNAWEKGVKEKKSHRGIGRGIMEMTMAVRVFKVAKVVAVESTWTPAKALWCAVVDAYIVNQRFADLIGDIRC